MRAHDHTTSKLCVTLYVATNSIAAMRYRDTPAHEQRPRGGDQVRLYHLSLFRPQEPRLLSTSFIRRSLKLQLTYIVHNYHLSLEEGLELPEIFAP
jgi:hypothetical protein